MLKIRSAVLVAETPIDPNVICAIAFLKELIRPTGTRVAGHHVTHRVPQATNYVVEPEHDCQDRNNFQQQLGARR